MGDQMFFLIPSCFLFLFFHPSPYIPFIYEDNQSLIKMIGFKWRCCECSNSIEKYRMLRRDERTKTKNRTESGKTSKTPDPTKQSQINYSQKTQSHSPESETVDLTDED